MSATPPAGSNGSTDPAAAAAAALAALLSEIGTITGPMLLGHLFNWALFGVLALQVYIYSISFPKDSMHLKGVVYFVFFLDVLQTAFATHYAWYVLASGWGNPLVLRFTSWTLATIPPLSGLIALVVQGFFAWRIKILGQGNKLYLPVLVLIGVTALGACIAAWYAGIVSGSIRDVAKASLLDPEVTAWLSGSVACDVIITITLVYQLSIRRNQGFKSANHIIHRAIRMTIETGALTSAVTIVELALYLNSSLTSWYFMLGMIIGKLYSNSLLATLNARATSSQSSQSNTSTGGAHVWNVRRGETTQDISIATNTVTFTDRKGDIEMGNVVRTRGSDADTKATMPVANEYDREYAPWK